MNAERAPPWAEILVVGEWQHGKSSFVAGVAVAVGQREALYRDRTAQVIWNEGGVTWDVSTRFGHGGSVEDNLCRLARQIVGLIIVVDSTTGPSAHTRAEAILARALNAPKPFVFLNKTDIATPDQIEESERRTRDVLQQAGWQDVTIIQGSAKDAWNGKQEPIGLPAIQSLMHSVAASARAIIGSKSEGPFWMPCRALGFGDGKKLSGLIRRGSVSVGDEIESLMFGAGSRHRVLAIDRILRPGKIQSVHGGEERDIVEITCSNAPDQKIDWRTPITLCAPDSLAMTVGFSADIHLLDGGESHLLEPLRRLDEIAITCDAGDFRVKTNFDGDPASVRPGLIQLQCTLPHAAPIQTRSSFRVCSWAEHFIGTAGVGIVTRLAS